MKNYYDILQVNKNADKEIISKIYKYLVKENHPDLFTGKDKELAEIKIKELNEAYEVLSDDKKRKEYDEELEYYNSRNDNLNINILENLQNENETLREELINNIYQNYQINGYNINQNGTQNSNSPLKDYITGTFKDLFFRIVLLILFVLVVLLISSSLIGKNILIR